MMRMPAGTQSRSARATRWPRSRRALTMDGSGSCGPDSSAVVMSGS